MSVNLLYAHLADNAFQSEGGKLNLIGIFAGLNSPGTIGVAQFPAVYPRIALAIGLATTETELPLAITFQDEAGKDVLPPFSGSFKIDRPADAKQEAANVNFNINFDAFRLEQAGKLSLRLSAAQKELTELQFNVIKTAPPSAPPPTKPS